MNQIDSVDNIFIMQSHFSMTLEDIEVKDKFESLVNLDEPVSYQTQDAECESPNVHWDDSLSDTEPLNRTKTSFFMFRLFSK